MSIKSRDFLEKIEVLAATGMPGAYKIIIFYLLQEVHGLFLLGELASWQSIAQIFGFFTAIGWCSLILVRVAKAGIEKEKISIFNRLALMGLMTLIGLCLLIFIFCTFIGKPAVSLQIIIWLCAWTFYQMPRHYWIALKKYRQVLALDILIIITSILCITALDEQKVSFALATCMLSGGGVSFFVIQKGNWCGVDFGYEIKGLEYGFANLLSGGIALSIVPLTSYFSGKDLAGAVSLFFALSGVALLLPRAISINKLPQISQLIDKPKELYKVINPINKKIKISNILTTSISFIMIVVVVWEFRDLLDVVEISVIFLIITLQGTVGTQSLIYANILMAREMSSGILKINIYSFLMYCSLILLLYFFSVDNAVTYICLMMLFLSCYRFLKMKNYSAEKNNAIF